MGKQMKIRMEGWDEMRVTGKAETARGGWVGMGWRCRSRLLRWRHMGVMESQITCNPTVCSAAYKRNNRGYIKAPHYFPIVRRIHRSSVVSLTPGQYCGECFHVMTTCLKTWSHFFMQMQHVGIATFAAVFAENDQFPFPTLPWVIREHYKP